MSTNGNGNIPTDSARRRRPDTIVETPSISTPIDDSDDSDSDVKEIPIRRRPSYSPEESSDESYKSEPEPTPIQRLEGPQIEKARLAMEKHAVNLVSTKNARCSPEKLKELLEYQKENPGTLAVEKISAVLGKKLTFERKKRTIPRRAAPLKRQSRNLARNESKRQKNSEERQWEEEAIDEVQRETLNQIENPAEATTSSEIQVQSSPDNREIGSLTKTADSGFPIERDTQRLAVSAENHNQPVNKDLAATLLNQAKPGTSDEPSTSNGGRRAKEVAISAICPKKSRKSIKKGQKADPNQFLYDFEKEKYLNEPPGEGEKKDVRIQKATKPKKPKKQAPPKKREDQLTMTYQDRLVISEIQKLLPNSGDTSEDQGADVREFFVQTVEKLEKAIEKQKRIKDQITSDLDPSEAREHWDRTEMTDVEHNSRITRWDLAIAEAAKEDYKEKLIRMDRGGHFTSGKNLTDYIREQRDRILQIMDEKVNEKNGDEWFNYRTFSLADIAEKRVDEESEEFAFFENAIKQIKKRQKFGKLEGVVQCMSNYKQKTAFTNALDSKGIDSKTFFEELEKVVGKYYRLPKGELFRRLILNVAAHLKFDVEEDGWLCEKCDIGKMFKGIPHDMNGKAIAL